MSRFPGHINGSLVFLVKYINCHHPQQRQTHHGNYYDALLGELAVFNGWLIS